MLRNAASAAPDRALGAHGERFLEALRDFMLGEWRGAAHAAGLLQHALGGRGVPEPDAGELGISIGHAFGNAAVLERAAHLQGRVIAEPLEPAGCLGVGVGAAQHQHRLWRPGSCCQCAAQTRLLAPGAAALRCGIEQVKCRCQHDAKYRAAVFDQRDVDGELAVSGNELAGTVEWVHQPVARPVRAFLGGRDHTLFGQHRNARHERREAVENAVVGSEVGGRHRRIVGFLCHRELVAIDGKNGLARSARESDHGGQQV